MAWRGTLSSLFACALLALLALPSLASAADPPPGSVWTQEYIDEPDGTQLHADILRPANLPKDAKTPVILSIGPYFNHSGELGLLGLIEFAPPDLGDGPSARFYDFIVGSKLLEKGYTWVQVDLRGFGGSSGCLDWGGPGEKMDVKTAVEWAAKQPWSTGKVGMYGKSYDGSTGLMGIAEQPQGLSAVIAAEPVYDLYRYLYMNRVRFINSLETPALYDAIAGSPGRPGDPLAYNFNSVNDTQKPGCPAQNYAEQQDPNHDSEYWKQRDLITLTKGKKTPLFITQGFIEDNTKPDGAFELYNGVAGPKRAWLGMWDHVRGSDTDEDGRLLMGRHGWNDEAIRFFDRHLKGATPPVDDPAIAVQSSDGGWRGEPAWPPADALPETTKLRPGTYSDDSLNNGKGEPNGLGIWTISPPLPHPVHLAGEPKIALDVELPASDANLVADVYDIDKDGKAQLVSRGAYLLEGSGKLAFSLYGNDWKLPAGHRIGVLVTGANSEWWLHTPTGQQVTVKSASITMPFLGCRRTQAIEGAKSVFLEEYEKDTITVDGDTIESSESKDFALPAAQGDCTPKEIAAGGPKGGKCKDRRKFSFRLRHRRGQRVISVRAYVNGKLVLKRRAHDIKRITLRKLPLGKFRVKIVTRTSDKRGTTTVRTYKGCRKSRPTGRHHGPRRR